MANYIYQHVNTPFTLKYTEILVDAVNVDLDDVTWEFEILTNAGASKLTVTDFVAVQSDPKVSEWILTPTLAYLYVTQADMTSALSVGTYHYNVYASSASFDRLVAEEGILQVTI